MTILPLRGIAESLACSQPDTVHIFPPSVRLFVGDHWVTIGQANMTRAGFVMCIHVPPPAELVATPEAEAAGMEAWMLWGARVN